MSKDGQTTAICMLRMMNRGPVKQLVHGSKDSLTEGEAATTPNQAFEDMH